MKNSKLLKNIVTGFGGQLIAIFLGLIVPRLFITSYGSDVNGLISTITQIFTYLALLEAGIGQAAKNLLYKPFQTKDREGVSLVASIAKTYYRKFTIIYAVAVLALAFLLPELLKTNVDPIEIVLIVILEGMSGVISFYYIETASIIIGVDGKSYVNNEINLLNKIAGYAVKIVMAYLGLNIILLQLAYFFVTIAKVFFYNWYFRKNYAWIELKKVSEEIKLSDRNSYILTEICWTIFSSTDMIVLSTFLSTQMASVYGIYNMIFSNITLLVNSVFQSVNYLLGYSYHENIEKYARIHDAFNSIFLGLMTVLMSVCYVLTIPFVTLYTKGVTDVEYIYPSLPIMFCLIQLISWSRYTSGQLTGIAGYAKQTSYVSLIEAIINLSLSVLLVRKQGIVGVTIATVIALPIKVLWCTYIADRKVMKRSYMKSISIIGTNFLFFLGVVLTFRFYRPAISSYLHFFIWGISLTVVFGVIGMGLNFLINRDCWKIIRKYILKQ